MERLGAYLIFFAVGSAILSQTSYQFRLTMWMDDLGNTAWLLRAIMLLVGGFLVLGRHLSRPQVPVRPAPQHEILSHVQPVPTAAYPAGVNPGPGVGRPAPAQAGPTPPISSSRVIEF